MFGCLSEKAKDNSVTKAAKAARAAGVEDDRSVHYRDTSAFSQQQACRNARQRKHRRSCRVGPNEHYSLNFPSSPSAAASNSLSSCSFALVQWPRSRGHQLQALHQMKICGARGLRAKLLRPPAQQQIDARSGKRRRMRVRTPETLLRMYVSRAPSCADPTL
jgi:hypothetical protein